MLGPKAQYNQVDKTIYWRFNLRLSRKRWGIADLLVSKTRQCKIQPGFCSRKEELGKLETWVSDKMP